MIRGRKLKKKVIVKPKKTSDGLRCERRKKKVKSKQTFGLKTINLENFTILQSPKLIERKIHSKSFDNKCELFCIKKQCWKRLNGIEQNHLYLIVVTDQGSQKMINSFKTKL